MRNTIRLTAGVGLLAACCGAAWAQEPMQPATPTEPAPPADAGRGVPFGLYLSAALGEVDGEPLNTSIITRIALDRTTSTFELPGQTQGRAAVGWKLPRGKGDFRLAYTGYDEDTYKLASRGESTKVFQLPGVQGSVRATDFIDWWNVNASGGLWVAERTPRLWVSATDDLNGNGAPDPEEIQRLAVDRRIVRNVSESMNNRLQTYDALYGREFGGRRYSSRWWAGLRYFQYSGQIIAPAWLGSNDLGAGTGFTDNALLGPLLFEQNSSGGGPTGIWEVHFNFFERRLVLYLRGQSGFMFASLEADTGDFFTLVPQSVGSAVVSPGGRLHEKRRKSVWQSTGEAGVRFQLANGLKLEAGYSISGYLDAFLLPSVILVPETQAQSISGTTALYSTQDYEVDGWHAGMAFQF